ncbi:ffa98ccf-8762-4569-9cdc-003db0e899c6 [Sclerotinia trifoliorum]|uniref:Ffa98ccf-8762-4569-9cdc-003db0e899c6 n=1 Tax=Sclerotinia trifoliorum TaxID=28548 RepID=A0A8H2ZMT6_9HELO|nr:ffa98ccf-8762-4569-9cdc-003db0e899c6 [Sclerotinia trifoliorum]
MSEETYKKVGRGGAGNFYSKQDVERSNGTSDLEAQSSSSTKHNKTPSLISQALRAVGGGPPPEYQHTGRGGAGNLASPASLLNSGLTQTTTNYQNPTINPAPPSSSPRNVKSSMQSVVYKGGRGGAGNYNWEADEIVKENQRISEENSRREIEKKVVGDVDGDGEGGLRKPGRAYDINAGKEMEGEGGCWVGRVG